MNEEKREAPGTDANPVVAVAKAALFLYVLAVCLALCCICCGCVYKGAKVTEGTDFSLGISVPGTEGALDLSILNYLTGFRLAVARNAMLDLNYTVAETNSYLGIVHTLSEKRVKAKVKPCEGE